MAGLRPHLEHGPETHLVSTNLVGGTYVAPDTGSPGKVRAAIGTDTTVLGLAIGDAAATAGMVAGTLDTWGRNIAGQLTPPNEVAVAYRGSWWLKNTSGTLIAYGAPIYVGAGGTITGTASTSGLIVGRCIEPLGIANNAEGRVRITLK